MISLTIVLRLSSLGEHQQGSVGIRLIRNRQVKTITIPNCRIYPYEWDKKAQKVIYPVDNLKREDELKQIEQCVCTEVEQIKTHLVFLEEIGRYSVEDVVRIYRLGKSSHSILAFSNRLAIDLEQRGQNRTAKAYRTVARGIVLFNKGKDIPMRDINSSLIKEFEIHLKKTGRLPNTISYYMRNLRAIYNKSIIDSNAMQRRGQNLFAPVYTGVTKTMNRALTIAEIKQLQQLDIPRLYRKELFGTPAFLQLMNLYQAQRYFFFCFNARGMCFIDLAYLQKKNIQNGVIKYMRRKTGQQIEVKINNHMREIISSFVLETAGTPFVFPIIKDLERSFRLQYENGLRTQNQRLKELAKLAGIRKPISTHWARHSWANIGKQQNIPIRVLSECLGHSSEKTTLIYLGQIDNSLLDSANDLVVSALV